MNDLNGKRRLSLITRYVAMSFWLSVTTLFSQGYAQVVPVTSIPTKSTMTQLFGHFQILLPLSLNEAAFKAKANRKKIDKELTEMRSAAAHLEDHGQNRDLSFYFVGKTLKAKLEQATAAFREGEWSEARFDILNLTETCIGCHTKLPDLHRHPASEAFFAKLDKKSLTLREGIWLNVATRDFDAATKALEQEFRRPEAKGNSLDVSLLIEYLKLTLVVVPDLQRATLTLQDFSKRKMPAYKSHLVKRWIEQLKTMQRRKLLETISIEAAQTLMTLGQDSQEFVLDNNGLPFMIAAESVLQQYLTTLDKNDKNAISRTYYLLGVAELSIGQTFGLSQGEFYLENAIRLNPKGTYSRVAYELLERQVYFEHESSQEIALPEEVDALLGDLRTMIPE